jgi:hypothetical protein
VYRLCNLLHCTELFVMWLWGLLHIWNATVVRSAVLMEQVSYGFIYSLTAWAMIGAQNRPQLFPFVFLIIHHSHSFTISCCKTRALKILTSKELISYFDFKESFNSSPLTSPLNVSTHEGRMCICDFITSFFSGPVFVILYVSIPLVLI